MLKFIMYLIYCVALVFHTANGGVVDNTEHLIIDVIVGLATIAAVGYTAYFFCWIYVKKIKPKIIKPKTSYKKNDDSDIEHQEDQNS